MVFIAWEILNDTKQYGRFGYVHAKNKEFCFGKRGMLQEFRLFGRRPAVPGMV